MEQSFVDSSKCLRSLMQSAGIASYRALAAQAEVSRWQVQQLRAGKVAQMRVAILTQLAAALKISLGTLLNKFGLADASTKAADQQSQLSALQQE
ncbi:MAG: helix-turn-helix transcriptional regulator, partial [Phormidesmis sp.]